MLTFYFTLVNRVCSKTTTQKRRLFQHIGTGFPQWNQGLTAFVPMFQRFSNRTWVIWRICRSRTLFSRCNYQPYKKITPRRHTPKKHWNIGTNHYYYNYLINIFIYINNLAHTPNPISCSNALEHAWNIGTKPLRKKPAHEPWLICIIRLYYSCTSRWDVPRLSVSNPHHHGLDSLTRNNHVKT